MISLLQILQILKKDNNFREIVFEGEYYYQWDQAVEFANLSYDSRACDSETLFFAKGINFKGEYLSGLDVPFYISEVDYEVDLPAIIVSNVKRALSLIAQAFYDYPQNKLTTLAITGTKGKTTSAYFAKSILDEMNDNKTALLSTAQTTLDGQNYFKSELTTPESLDLMKMMATAVSNGMTHLVMEVSSQAYKTERVYGLDFDVAGFTNFFPDHIGKNEHPTMEDYFYCKSQLIEHASYFVANHEMSHFNLVEQKLAAFGVPADFYGAGSDNTIIQSDQFHFETSGKVGSAFDIRLLGRFNQENALATALMTSHLGASLEQIKAGLAKAVVPGRMELLTARNGAHIYVDYAHNGVSLENLVGVVESHHSGNLQLILGATGNKGESRRKDFGQVIENHKRLNVILTTDDSNYEAPSVIADEIKAHIDRNVDFIQDRELAIKEAISRVSNSSDAVIIAGKGTDKFQLYMGQRVPYIGDTSAAEKYL
ncbi:UDP-N-acetylmuramoyl-L-alanyl-D-glutamate--L-lysine ligase [Lactococcus fujiensis]|uniref:UDP-N-acetylmuramoylalanyl-D-glutamate--2, 6-diaminopimelate ligase n=1 Tax=Lactococcus fujiensis JCM 16395 TaxID=1291764 RepID=A0A2A5RM43_9LACT|nr:UDP-N-acetylmuramoyl-L-alanyl-D-glutamate--L-lysine ligase [Lactococcus fujiensis]PCS00346.1 UDP-N-acetylmuramoylalanyl-D-glutamate--2,6-diaminopimelate ligase [Lactococcus fujiensis JCM 16395]